MAIQADKPKDDWYAIVKELQDRAGSKEESPKIDPCCKQDTKSIELHTDVDDEKRRSKSPGRRTSLNTLKEKFGEVISRKPKN